MNALAEKKMFQRLIALMRCITLFFIVVVSCLGATCYAKNMVTLATLDWEPYIGEHLKGGGYVAILVRDAYAVSGYDVDLKYMPWPRVLTEIGDGQYDGYMPEYYVDRLTKDYLVSDPFPGGPLGFFKRKGDSIHYRTLTDLKPYKIGVVRGYVNTEEFDKANFLQKEPANNDIINLRKVEGNRIDLAVMDKYVGYYLMKKDAGNLSAQLEFMTPPLEEKSLHVCILKSAPYAKEKMEAFNKGLKVLKDSGQLEQLRVSFGF